MAVEDTHRSSCRRLAEVATEFQAQGLELDAALLAWGTDLVRRDGAWSNANARGYKRGAKVRLTSSPRAERLDQREGWPGQP